MEDLKRSIANVPNNPKDFHEWFQEISELLMNKYHIETHVASYRITEIEFYYYNENHPDKSTYGYSKDFTKLIPRIKRLKQGQQKTLTWFFHYSGLDISIGNEDNPGGILIRKIERLGDEKEIFNGPLIVQLELMNQGVPLTEIPILNLSWYRIMILLSLKFLRNLESGLKAADLRLRNIISLLIHHDPNIK